MIDLYKSMRLRFPASSIKLADNIANQVGRTAQNLEAASSVACLHPARKTANKDVKTYPQK
jgi:hypothetical protein